MFSTEKKNEEKLVTNYDVAKQELCYGDMIFAMLDYICEDEQDLKYVAICCDGALRSSISNKNEIQEAYDLFVNYLDDETKKEFITMTELLTIDINKEN